MEFPRHLKAVKAPGKAKSSCNVGAMPLKCNSDRFESDKKPSSEASHDRERRDNKMVFCKHGGRRVHDDLSAQQVGSKELHLSALTMT